MTATYTVTPAELELAAEMAAAGPEAILIAAIAAHSAAQAALQVADAGWQSLPYETRGTLAVTLSALRGAVTAARYAVTAERRRLEG